LAVPKKVQEEWARKGWIPYLWDSGAWLLDKVNEAVTGVFSAAVSTTYEGLRAADDLGGIEPLSEGTAESVGGAAYWAAKELAFMLSGYGWYRRGAWLLGTGVELGRSWWYSKETDWAALAQVIAPSGPAFLAWFLSWNLRDANLPAAIRTKLESGTSTLQLLLGLYYLGGAFKGDFALRTMEQWLQEALFGGYDETRTVRFRDLPIPLNIAATDLTNGRLLNFPSDLTRAPYGYTAEAAMEFSVAKAVRASMSIPGCFEPAELPYADGAAGPGRRALLVDGGVLSNYPVHPFLKDEPRTTIGFWLGDSMDQIAPTDVTTLRGYGAGMFGAMQNAHDRAMVELMGDRLVNAEIDLRIPLTDDEEEKRRKRVGELRKEIAKGASSGKAVAELEVLKALEHGRPCDTLDFALTPAQKDRLVENGREAARRALADGRLAALVEFGVD